MFCAVPCYTGQIRRSFPGSKMWIGILEDKKGGGRFDDCGTDCIESVNKLQSPVGLRVVFLPLNQTRNRPILLQRPGRGREERSHSLPHVSGRWVSEQRLRRSNEPKEGWPSILLSARRLISMAGRRLRGGQSF